MKRSNYMTRALRHSDGRFAQILGKLGYTATNAEVIEAKPEVADELTAARAEYQRVFDKKPYHGWSAEMLREKIVAALKDEASE